MRGGGGVRSMPFTKCSRDADGVGWALSSSRLIIDAVLRRRVAPAGGVRARREDERAGTVIIRYNKWTLGRFDDNIPGDIPVEIVPRFSDQVSGGLGRRAINLGPQVCNVINGPDGILMDQP